MQKHSIKPCPMCHNPVSWDDNPWKPFCSERCKMIDLGYWDMEQYKIPGEKPDYNDEEVEDAEDQKI